MRGENQEIAGVVVLFNPTADVFENINSYVDQVDRLYVVDNSPNPNEGYVAKLVQLPQVKYVSNPGNKGIAYALNCGAENALADGYRYLLTMDQDTKLSEKFVLKLREGFDRNEAVGIMAPRYDPIDDTTERYEKVMVAMTSGNLLDLAAYREAGPFINELFIDHVDHEYCLRLTVKGYSIVQDNKVLIRHSPGKRIQLPALLKSKSFSSHSPLRLYYFCRNGFYVSKWYEGSVPAFRTFFRGLMVRILLKSFLERDFLERFRMLRRGFLDYKAGVMGALVPDRKNITGVLNEADNSK